jgi:outer membrane protein OmpA-like peptidoglycan-associated protein
MRATPNIGRSFVAVALTGALLLIAHQVGADSLQKIGPIQFERNSAALARESEEILDSCYERWQLDASVRILLIVRAGHNEEHGIAERRASAIQHYLVKLKGMAAEGLIVYVVGTKCYSETGADFSDAHGLIVPEDADTDELVGIIQCNSRRGR